MDAIDFSTMKTRVALRLGNMQSSDPFYSYLGSWVNEAGNRVIMRALSRNLRRRQNLFPELYDLWEDTTIDGQDYISTPDDILYVDALYSLNTSAAVDYATDARYSMSEIGNNRTWQFLSRSQTGYPNKWHRYGNRLYVHPTPTATYVTKVLIAGFAREGTLSGNSDVFVMDPMWHPAVIDYAVYLGATELGWIEDAASALTACDRKLEETTTILGRENASDLMPVSRVANDPTN